MNKRFLLGAAVVLGIGIAASWMVVKHTESDEFWLNASRQGTTSGDQSSQARPQPAATRLDPVQQVRLAIGGLGLKDDDQNGRLGDLIVANLTSESGLELVDRQSLQKVLREAELNLSGLVRAKDAIRVGQLLRADWFLLGTPTTVSGTNSLVARVVDARTGIIRDLVVVRSTPDLPKLASDLADFVRLARHAASGEVQIHNYLAIGGFEDLSINNRYPDLSKQLRAYLTTAFQSTNVTLVEREVVDALLEEVRMDLAGLTGTTNSPTQMQHAFWLVDGFYQSYEVSGPQIDLVLSVQQILGSRSRSSLREAPGEPLFRRARDVIQQTIATGAKAALLNSPTPDDEIDAQMRIGKQRSRLGDGDLIGEAQFSPWGSASPFAGGYGAADLEKTKQNLNEAIQAFQAALLLNPRNDYAMMYLAACFRVRSIGRIEEARNYYREILGMPRAAWASEAHLALAYTYCNEDDKKAAEIFEEIASRTRNAGRATYYRELARQSLAKAAPAQPASFEEQVSGAAAEVLKSLREQLENTKKTGAALNLGFGRIPQLYLRREGLADEINRMLPSWRTNFPELSPYLLARSVQYQTDTNSPVVQEFRRSFGSSAASPATLVHPESYFQLLHEAPFGWASEHRVNDLVLELDESMKHAGYDFAVPESYGKLARMFPPIYVSELITEHKVRLAYAFAGLGRNQEALEIVEALGTAPIQMTHDGIWGSMHQPFLPAKAAKSLREKLGMLTTNDLAQFELGKPFLTMDGPFAFLAKSDVVWVAGVHSIIQGDMNAKMIKKSLLPLESDTSVKCLCDGPGQMWIGTSGDGLIEYDKASGEFHRWTEKDGLLLNDIASLYLNADVLWIGFGGNPHGAQSTADRGGLGRMDLSSRRITAMTPPLPQTVDNAQRFGGQVWLDASNKPPRHRVVSIISIQPDELWLGVWRKGVQRYDVKKNTWETFQTADQENCVSSLVCDENLIAAGCLAADRDTWARTLQAGVVVKYGGLTLHSVGDSSWRHLYPEDGLPKNRITALALRGRDLFIGGEGFIAVMDIDHRTIRKVCYVRAPAVDKLQVEGAYLWAQIGWQLYRVPLQTLEDAASRTKGAAPH